MANSNAMEKANDERRRSRVKGTKNACKFVIFIFMMFVENFSYGTFLLNNHKFMCEFSVARLEGNVRIKFNDGVEWESFEPTILHVAVP